MGQRYFKNRRGGVNAKQMREAPRASRLIYFYGGNMNKHITQAESRALIEDAIQRRRYNNSLEGSTKNAIQSYLLNEIGFDTLEKDQEAIAKRLQDNAKRVEAGEYVDPKEYDSLIADAKKIGTRIGYYRNYLKNVSPESEDAIKSASEMSKTFLDASKAMGDQQKFFSNFKDADDYKKQMDAYKEQQRLTFDYDLNAGKAKLDAAKKKLDMYDNARKNTEHTGLTVSSQAKAEHTAVKEGYDALKEEYDLAKYYQTAYNYDKLAESEDFAKKSKKANSTWDIGETARAAEYINGRWDAKVAHAVNDFIDKINILDNNETVDAYNRYDFMTDDQVKTFNYIYNTQGQKKAQAYLDFIEGELSQKYAQKNKTSNFFVNALRALNAGTESIGEGLENLGLGIVKEGANLVTGGKTGSFGKSVDNLIKENAATSNSVMALAARKNEAGTLENFIYDIAQTAPTTLANMLPGGFVVTSLSAAGNAYAEATAEDKNSMQRIFMAIGEGSMEALTNLAQAKLGGDALDAFVDTATKNMGKTLGKSIAGNFIKYGYHSLSEGFEEAIQEIAGTGLRNMVYGEANKINWGDVGYAALLGATSAGILKSPSLVNDVYSSIKLPAPTESHFKETLDTAPEGSSLAERFNALTGNLEIQDSLMSADAIANVIEGHNDKAYKIIDDQIETYKYAKEYNKRNIKAKTDYFDTQISLLGTMKNLIESGKFNAEAARNATMQSTTLWQIAAENNDSAAKILLQDGLSNAQIEKTVLTDKGTQKAFERLTGVNLFQYKTVSQKRNAVKVVAEAYKAFAGSDAAKQVSDILKANNTISDANVRSANRIKAQDILTAAYKVAASEDQTARQNGDRHATDVAQAKMKLIDALKNDVRNGKVLSFASLDGSVAVNNASKQRIAAKTGSTQSAERAVVSSNDGKMAIESDLSAAREGINEEYVNMLESVGEGVTYESLSDAKKAVLENLDEKIEKAEGDEKAELIEQKKKVEEYISLLDASEAEVIDLIKQMGREEFNKRTKRHKEVLKKNGIDLDIDHGGELYFDEDGKPITEEEYGKLKSEGKKPKIVYQNGYNTAKTVGIFESIAFGRSIKTLDPETGEIISLRSGIDISAREAVDFVIGHETIHAGVKAGSDIVSSIINYISNTKIDTYYELGKRRAGKKVSAEADAHWNALKELYVKAEMAQDPELTREQAQAKVNDAYIYEEIAADYMGMLMSQTGMLDRIASKGGIVSKIKLAAKALISKLTGNKLDIRAERVKALMKKLDAAAKSNYGSLAKTANIDGKSQKSTESDESTEGERTVIEGEKGAENDKKMMVVGEGAETANYSELVKAKAMLKADPNADTVSETGWWLGKDGKWRYEIADDKMHFERYGLHKNPQTLKDYIKHDKLFRAYPHLRNVRVKFERVVEGDPKTNGLYDAINNTITLKSGRSNEDTKRTLVHEIQHAVQEYEEFSKGFNTNGGYVEWFNRVFDNVKETREYKSLKTAEERWDYVENIATLPGEGAIDKTAKSLYRNNYGEIEARATAERLYMDVDKRRKSPIVNDGNAYSLEEIYSKFVDNLRSMGYTDTQIKEKINGDKTNGRTEEIGSGTRGRNANGKHIETDRQSTQSPRNINSRGEGKNPEHIYDGRVKYSLSEIDADYLTAVENGDMGTAQRMVDEAAKAAGYSSRMYHGAKNGGGFTVFRDWGYFTENKAYAERYAQRENEKSLYEVYVKMDKPFDTRDTETREIFENEILPEYGASQIQESGLPDWTDGYDIADCIDENGLDYDAIVLDEGGDLVNGVPVSRGLSYVIKDSAQIKSADPVTYDDNGNVIPLSERFNEKNKDIRWSVSEESKIGASNDSPYDYDALIRKPDMILTVVDDTTVLSRADIKTEAINNAASIGYTNENGNAVVHVDDVDSDIIVPKKSIAHGLDRRTDAQSAVFVKIGEVLKNSVKVNELLPRAENIKNSYVLVGAAVGKNGTPYIVSFIVNKHSNEISEIDVLYSANTKKESAAFLPKIADNTATPTNSKISIAQLLNFVNNNFPDILPESVLRHFGHTERPKGTIGESALYSLSEEIETESEASYEQLKRQLEKQKQKNKELAGELIRTHGKKLDPKAVKANLKDIIERYQGTVKPADVERKFQRAFEYVFNKKLVTYNEDGSLKSIEKVKELDLDVMTEMFQDMATDIFNSAVEYEDTYSEYRSLLKELRDTGITVSEIDRGGDFDDVGGWSTFRKKNFGNVLFVNDGLPIDSYYLELADNYPELFPDTITHPADQAKQIADVARTIRESGITATNIYGGLDAEMIINEIAGDLYSVMKATDRKETFADKAAKKVEDAHLAEKMHYGAKIAELKRKNERREKILTEKFESRAADRSEKQQKAYQNKMVHRRAKDLVKRLMRPTKTKHIPEAMASDVGAFLSKLTWSDRTQTDIEFNAYINDLLVKAPKEFNDKPVENGFSVDLLGDLKAFNAKSIEAMTASETHELNELLRRMIHEVNVQDKVFHSTEKASVLASKAKSQFATARKERIYAGNKLINFIQYGAADPEAFFNALGIPVLTDAYHNLASRQNVFASTLRELTSDMRDIVNGKIPREWREEVKTFTTAYGQTVRITPAKAMTIYLLSRQEASRKRLISERGGIVPTETKLGFSKVETDKNGKTRKNLSLPKTVLGKHANLAEGDLITIQGLLTKEQIDVANKISELLNGKCAELGNQVSLETEGYRKFIVENYFPMMVAENGKTFEQLVKDANTQIAHKSFTKDRTGTAGVPLVVDDIFNVVDRHILGMSQYYAYDKALRDFQRIFTLRPEGQSSLRLTMDEFFGNGSSNKVTTFINNFIKDVQGAQMATGEETLISEKVLSTYKAAQVAGNLSVVVKQPTAIFRAMPEFSAKGNAAMLKVATTKSDIKEMIEHSGLAQLKAWGFSENTTAKSVSELYDKNATNLRGKIDNVTSFLAEQADMITWAAMWRASKAETSSLAEATEKFNEVIRRTQVVKSAFTSSRVTQQSGVAKLAFAFKNEPLKTFNYIRSTVNDVIAGKEGAKKKAVWVTVTAALNTATVAAISAGFSLLRDDEEDSEELFLEKFKENVIADLISNSTIMLGDIWTAVESAVDRRTVERMDLAVFTDAAELAFNVWDMLNKPQSEQKNTWMKILYDSARTISNFTGIPIGNAMRAIKSLHGSIVELSDDPVARYNMTKIWYNVEGIDNSTVRAKFRSILTDALDDGDYEAFEKIRSDLRAHGFSTTDIQKAVANSTKLYDAWNNGAEAFRAEVNKAMKYAKTLDSAYVMEAFKSKKTTLVNALYEAMKSGSKKATEEARNALLKHRDVETKRTLTEGEVDKLIEKKIESAINSEVKSRLADLYGTDAYEGVKKKILNEYRHFDGITSEYIDKIAKK